MSEVSALDRRFMAAAIRFSRRNAGLTATNPSVATLIVRDDGAGPVIVGRGVTALGGRPHAETAALAEAGELARGATAYVTLEPCSHHGRTPPCAEALVRAGVARVVAAAADPDPRVDGRGHAILRAAGIAVVPGVEAADAAGIMSGYLTRHSRNRPEIVLKLAVSKDGMLGHDGRGQVKITGPIADRQTHLLRARADAILVGVGTVIEDDPSLTCRLPGLAARSPLRIVLDGNLATPVTARVVASAGSPPTLIATLDGADRQARRRLEAAGCGFLACEADPASGRIALPELLEDLAARGIMSVLVEGGARVASSFLEAACVDRLILVEGAAELGAGGVPAPIGIAQAHARFRLAHAARFGDDRWYEFDLSA